MATCKLCGKIALLVDSHIIPRAFYDIKADRPSTALSNIKGQFPKRSRTGVYDKIVCNDCEQSFSPYDDYAVQILKHQLKDHDVVRVGGIHLGLRAKSIDYRLLKLFVISILWRASVTSQGFFHRVRLGPFEERAKKLLLDKDPGDAEEFSSWWSVFDVKEIPGTMDPFRERWSNKNAYRFYFGRVSGYIKVDSGPTPADFKPFIIQPGGDLLLIARKYSTSKDFGAMKTLLRTATRYPGK